MRRSLLLPGLGLLALTASGYSGCELFRPAQPEKPSTITIIRSDYTTPDSVLTTMARAIAAKGNSGGQTAYMSALAEPAADGRTFLATFDLATLEQFPNTPVPVPWLYDNEERFYGHFAGADGSLPHVLTWTKFLSDEVVGDIAADTSRILHEEYSVIVVQQNGSHIPEANGQADLVFVRRSNRWVLWRWIDRELANPPAGSKGTYGALRIRDQ